MVQQGVKEWWWVNVVWREEAVQEYEVRNCCVSREELGRCN